MGREGINQVLGQGLGICPGHNAWRIHINPKPFEAGPLFIRHGNGFEMPEGCENVGDDNRTLQQL